MNKIMSCYSARFLIDYAKSKGIDIISYLVELDTMYHIMQEPDQWMSYKDWIKLIRYIENSTGKTAETIGYEIVTNVNSKLTFRIWIFEATPLYIIKKLGLVNKIVFNYTNKNIYARMSELSNNHMQLIFKVVDPKFYCNEVCDFNKGCIKGIIEMKGYNNVRLEEEICTLSSEGYEACVYNVYWDAKGKSDIPKIALEKIKTDDNKDSILVLTREIEELIIKE